MKSRDALGPIEQEIIGERASALAKAVEALEAALEALAEAPGREALSDARERLWYVVIQREAIGLRRHEVLYDVLRVPREVRLGMGPRRR